MKLTHTNQIGKIHYKIFIYNICNELIYFIYTERTSWLNHQNFLLRYGKDRVLC